MVSDPRVFIMGRLLYSFEDLGDLIDILLDMYILLYVSLYSLMPVNRYYLYFKKYRHRFSRHQPIHAQ